jgi:hypothetical protein
VSGGPPTIAERGTDRRLDASATGTRCPTSSPPTASSTKGGPMAFILWLIAVILVIAGIFALFRKQFIYGIVLIVVGFLVGPGGVSIFT